ncbi:5E5 antigen-like [Phocoena phocoena]|uniref:5E5 antigen-like n=1 Tax=Phocoena phocoena TaxID=9742 RepID=UPI003306BCBE
MLSIDPSPAPPGERAVAPLLSYGRKEPSLPGTDLQQEHSLTARAEAPPTSSLSPPSRPPGCFSSRQSPGDERPSEMLVRPQLQGPQLPRGNLLPTSASGQKEPLAHGLLQEGPTDAELEPQLKGAVVTCRKPSGDLRAALRPRRHRDPDQLPLDLEPVAVVTEEVPTPGRAPTTRGCRNTVEEGEQLQCVCPQKAQGQRPEMHQGPRCGRGTAHSWGEGGPFGGPWIHGAARRAPGPVRVPATPPTAGTLTVSVTYPGGGESGSFTRESCPVLTSKSLFKSQLYHLEGREDDGQQKVVQEPGSRPAVSLGGTAPRPAASRHRGAAWAADDRPRRGPPAGERPCAPRRPRASAQLAPGRWEEREVEKERRFPSAARVRPAPRRTRRKRRSRPPGCLCAAPSPRRPGRALARPSCETFSFWFAPPEKCGQGWGGGRAGFAAAAREEEVVPAGARPGRGNAQPARPPPAPAARLAPGPRPAATLAGRARRGSGGGGGRCGPAARRSQQCGAGKTKGFHFASFPVFHLRSQGAARDPLPAGAAPLGTRSRARPGFPADPPLPSPAPQAQGPARSDSRFRGIRPYCPRGTPRARPGSRAAPARAPTGLREQEPGAPRKPSPRRRRRSRCPPDAAVLGWRSEARARRPRPAAAGEAGAAAVPALPRGPPYLVPGRRRPRRRAPTREAAAAAAAAPAPPTPPGGGGGGGGGCAAPPQRGMAPGSVPRSSGRCQFLWPGPGPAPGRREGAALGVPGPHTPRAALTPKRMLIPTWIGGGSVLEAERLPAICSSLFVFSSGEGGGKRREKERERSGAAASPGGRRLRRSEAGGEWLRESAHRRGGRASGPGAAGTPRPGPAWEALAKRWGLAGRAGGPAAAAANPALPSPSFLLRPFHVGPWAAGHVGGRESARASARRPGVALAQWGPRQARGADLPPSWPRGSNFLPGPYAGRFCLLRPVGSGAGRPQALALPKSGSGRQCPSLARGAEMAVGARGGSPMCWNLQR